MPPPTTFNNISHYNHLDFTSFTYFNAPAASHAHLISPGDSNCAFSEPNALFAWRQQNPRHWPRFILNTTHAAEKALSPYFDLSGFAVKCMNNTPQYSRITVQAWGIDFSDPSAPVARQRYLLIWTNIRAGTQVQYPINCAELFPGWGVGVNMVEMWATTAEDEDWPFCVDDIRVVFHEDGNDEDEARLSATPMGWQKVEMHDLGFELRAERLW